MEERHALGEHSALYNTVFSAKNGGLSSDNRSLSDGLSLRPISSVDPTQFSSAIFTVSKYFFIAAVCFALKGTHSRPFQIHDRSMDAFRKYCTSLYVDPKRRTIHHLNEPSSFHPTDLSQHNCQARQYP